MQKTNIYKMILCALFAALTAVFSQIALPIGPVPINLATFVVFCAAALLGSKLGVLSLIIWVALGVAGVPVFSMFRSGLGALVGPTGGYIIGYIPAAFITGLLIEKFNKSNKIHLYIVSMLVGSLVCYIMGTAWFMYSLGRGLWDSLMICVIPFLPGDIIKVITAAMIAKRIRPMLNKI